MDLSSEWLPVDLALDRPLVGMQEEQAERDRLIIRRRLSAFINSTTNKAGKEKPTASYSQLNKTKWFNVLSKSVSSRSKQKQIKSFAQAQVQKGHPTEQSGSWSEKACHIYKPLPVWITEQQQATHCICASVQMSLMQYLSRCDYRLLSAYRLL